MKQGNLKPDEEGKLMERERKPAVHRDEWRLLVGLLLVAAIAALVLQWLGK